MNLSEINNLMTETKKEMDALFELVNDKSLSKADRSFFYNEYLQKSTDWLKQGRLKNQILVESN